ncbi:PP2C family protein-serine/threonine phosphatase [Mariniblastus fucicola]|uniref:Stage II sporulation protein E (SpoIIE) n=1 Tax=Mariniblastus fucicola TaxID=980251 RepID=A0A5B9P5N7_9BACT|nr:PP2C family protein-serine/threonine phosphatase [Mariniblastus fucicola]QEG21574.1 Stage II sporulation protein E (SpoIIE) [Mariniblastus fucicola]
MKLESNQMRCTEIVGSNLATSKAYRTHGLDIYVDSSPFHNSRIGGGDVYYVTSCHSDDSGRVTRLMLADISGHGEEAAGRAISLRGSLRKNVNQKSQSNFVQRMNEEFIESSPRDQIATAVAASYFVDQRRLSLGIAGHPNPLLFRQSAMQWYKIDEQALRNETSLANVPFGICASTSFPTRNIAVEDGDMFLLYSDALTESLDSNHDLLGIDGVLQVLNESPEKKGPCLISNLRQRIRSINPQNLMGDDATLILGQFAK